MDSMDTNPVAGDTVVEMDNIQTVADEIVATDGGGEVVVTDGGDEIVATDGGDDVVATDGGNEVVATDGGDEVVATDGGDEVVATDGGDEVVASDGGDEIVAADGGDAEGQLQKEIMAAVSESAPDRCNEVAVSYDPAQTTYIFTFVDSNMTSQEVTPTITTAVNQTISSLDAAEVLVVAAESATDLEEAVLEQVEGKSPIETQTVEDKSTNETQTESESVNQSVTETAEPDLNVETISYIEKKPEYVNEGSDEKLKPESNGPLAQKITEHSPGFQSISNTLEVKTASESDSNMVMVPPEVIEQADEVIKTLQSIITPKDIGKKRKRMSEFKEHGISQTDSLRNTEVEVFESTKTKKSLENEGKKSKSGKKCVVIAKNSIPVRNKRKTKKPQRLLDSETETELETTSKEKPKIITLPTVTKLNLGFQDLYIEVEIEDELFVSSLNKQPLCNGKTKYSFRISNHETESSLVEETSCASEKGPNKLRTRGKQLHSDKETKQSQLTGTAKKLKVKKGRPRKKIKLEACEIEKEVSDVDLKLDGTSEIIETLVEMSDENADKKIEINIASSHEYTECLKLEASVNNLSGIIDSNVEIDDGKSDNYDEEDAGMEADAEIDDVKKSVKLPKKRKQKRVKEEVASETEKEKPIKEKRKYTRRNAYSSSDRDNNYTVKKQDSGLITYHCDLCSFMTRYKGSMRDHTRTHSGDRPFVCQVCGKGFSNQTNFNNHVPIHSDERPYSCEICGLAFKIKRLLTLHSRRHRTTGTHTCQYCGKQFYSSTEVKKHASVHTGEKKYKCLVCGKLFSQDSGLSRHRYLHTGGGRHQCHYCGAIFIRKEYYRAHLRKHHGDTSIDKVRKTHLQPIQQLEQQPDGDHIEVEGYARVQFAIIDDQQPHAQVYYDNPEMPLPLVQREVEIAAREIEILVAGQI